VWFRPAFLKSALSVRFDVLTAVTIRMPSSAMLCRVSHIVYLRSVRRLLVAINIALSR
jgi:hypothetical protein